jgi:hypothetical protein
MPVKQIFLQGRLIHGAITHEVGWHIHPTQEIEKVCPHLFAGLGGKHHVPGNLIPCGVDLGAFKAKFRRQPDRLTGTILE